MKDNKLGVASDEIGKNPANTGFSLSDIATCAEDLSKIFGVGIRFCLMFGCLIAVFYFLSIGYFPQGLSLGDGLLFLMVAICFGAVYAIFLCFILSPAMAIKELKDGGNKKLSQCFLFLIVCGVIPPKKSVSQK